MAAEHICFGPESCKEQRVDYFNNHARYDCGHALTYWDYSNTLPNYSNAYLFGQYLCTRYAQNANAGGTNVYRTILEEMKKAPKSEMLDTIAALLETTPYDLVTDFWTAVFLNQDSGKYGFNGEAWADQLTPYIHDIASLPNLSGNIKNGGAIAFRLDENGFTPDTKKSIAFIVIDENGNVAKDQPVKVTLQESTHGTITLPKFFVEGQTFTFAAKPETGCVFGGFRVDGVFSTNTEFKVTAPLTVSGVFTLPYDLGFGSCGKNTVWFLTDEDDNDVWETLTIFGSGSTYNYSYSTSNPSPVPWLSKATDIKNVIVDPGVKVLGSYLFYRHTQLKTITLPQSLVAIQPGVFYYCSALENANLPGSLEYIGA